MTDNPVLADTSIWIEYFRNKNRAVVERVDRLLETDRIVTLELVEAELYRGARSEKEIRFLEEYFARLPVLETPIHFWREVGRFCYKLARKGFLPHLADACIALAALENRVTLFSADKDFRRIAALSDLKLFEA
mgnify:CR=1 FL=1